MYDIALFICYVATLHSRFDVVDAEVDEAPPEVPSGSKDRLFYLPTTGTGHDCSIGK